MQLYIIRHADAGSRDTFEGDDADRPLTPLGHRQARALGDAFHRQGLSVAAVVSSPFVRARETAEAFLKAWPGGPAVTFSDLLAAGELRKRKLTKYLDGVGHDAVAVVGHDPDLSNYLGWLIGGDPERFPLAKGGAALVEFDEGVEKGEGTLAWVVTPEWFVGDAPAEPTAV